MLDPISPYCHYSWSLTWTLSALSRSKFLQLGSSCTPVERQSAPIWAEGDCANNPALRVHETIGPGGSLLGWSLHPMVTWNLHHVWSLQVGGSLLWYSPHPRGARNPQNTGIAHAGNSRGERIITGTISPFQECLKPKEWGDHFRRILPSSILGFSCIPEARRSL